MQGLFDSAWARKAPLLCSKKNGPFSHGNNRVCQNSLLHRASLSHSTIHLYKIVEKIV
jgi:hypothetical protein